MACEAELYPSMYDAIEGKRICLAPGRRIAEGIAVKEPGEITRAIIEARW